MKKPPEIGGLNITMITLIFVFDYCCPTFPLSQILRFGTGTGHN